MPPVVHDAATFISTSEHRFLFDTNIWLPIVAPSFRSSPARATTDSSVFLSRCQVAGSTLLADLLVMSEIANVILRRSFNNSGWATQSFKRWRAHSDSADARQDASHALTQVCALTSAMTLSLGRSELVALSAATSLNQADFNDVCLAMICRTQ
ncbi:MAG: hypothetical protein GEEBNDBF_02648 [bacterium]|nr:hypothetical protein [bacterium]